jgi:hypothetical protein
MSVTPDAGVAPCSPAFIAALQTVGVLVTDNAQLALHCCIKVSPGVVTATNGHVLLEADHGLDMPTVCVPKVFATVLAKIGKAPVSVGASDSSLTVWFDDGSWLRTQLLAFTYPDTNSMLPTDESVLTISADFFKAAGYLSQFTDDADIYVDGKTMSTHKHEEALAYYELSQPFGTAHFSGNMLKLVQSHVTYYTLTNRAMLFFGAYGSGVRGAISFRA